MAAVRKVTNRFIRALGSLSSFLLPHSTLCASEQVVTFPTPTLPRTWHPSRARRPAVPPRAATDGPLPRTPRRRHASFGAGVSSRRRRRQRRIAPKPSCLIPSSALRTRRPSCQVSRPRPSTKPDRPSSRKAPRYRFHSPALERGILWVGHGARRDKRQCSSSPQPSPGPTPSRSPTTITVRPLAHAYYLFTLYTAQLCGGRPAR